MTLKHLSAFLVVVASGCAMKMNGKSVGFGGSSASADPTSSGSSGSSIPAATYENPPESEADTSGGDPQKQGFYAKYARYAEAPRDPYASVKDGKPVVVENSYEVRASEGSDCTALHDHCLDKETWFFDAHEGWNAKKPVREVHPGFFTTDGPEGPVNVGDLRMFGSDSKFTAYKTVPASKANLDKGRLVVALNYPAVTPADGGSAYKLGWSIGVVDHVDWDLNKVYLVGAEDDSIAIAATRVCALASEDGGKVELVGGLTKAQVEVKPTDVIKPDPAVE